MNVNNSKNKQNLRNKLRHLFEASRDHTGYQDLVNKCRKLYTQTEDEDLFFTEFTTVLRYCLVFPGTVPVDRMFSFAAKFAVSLHTFQDEKDDSDQEEETDSRSFVIRLFEFLFESHSAALPEARLRCMQLLYKLLCNMPQSLAISDKVWEELSDTVLCRIQDKSPQVRVQAVQTAAKLQDPKNPNCKIVQALMFHLNDPAAAVRRAVVSVIALSKATIVYILGRTRDVNDNVRRNTYVLFSKVKVLSISIKFRILILERGLQDRSEMVRNCVQKLVVIHWLENFNRDILKFLEALDVVTCADTAILTLNAMFRVLPLEEVVKCLPLDEDTHLIHMDKLSPESALLWRCLASYLSTEQREDELEVILPNLTTFCEYVARFYPPDKSINPDVDTDEQWTQLKDKETVKHLLELAKVFDFRDEMGRSSLKKLIVALLMSPRSTSAMVESMVQLMVSVVPDTQQFMQELIEVISELREPLTMATQPHMPPQEKMKLDLQISHLKVDLNELQEREYKAVNDKDYALAQSIADEIKQISFKIDELKSLPTKVSHEVLEQNNDPETRCKCLSILMNMIQYSDLRSLTPILRSMKDDLVDQCLRSEDLLTQSKALHVLAQFCILDKEVAKENLLRLVLMLSETGEDEINIPALQAIFDIIQRYGVATFENLPDSSATSHEQLEPPEDSESLLERQSATNAALRCISVLKELLNCKVNEKLQTTALEGLCKLLACGVIFSSSLLSLIIVQGFSPIVDSESEDYIRQVFMVFFPVFAANTPRSQEMIEAAFIPTMRTIINAPLGSPKADINPRDVASFLIEHTRPDINKYTSKTLHIHNNLAVAMCHEMLRDMTVLSELGLISCYLKSLLQLHLSFDSPGFRSQLFTLIRRVETETSDRMCLRLIKNIRERFMEKIQTKLQSIENTLETTKNDDTAGASRSRCTTATTDNTAANDTSTDAVRASRSRCTTATTDNTAANDTSNVSVRARPGSTIKSPTLPIQTTWSESSQRSDETRRTQGPDTKLQTVLESSDEMHLSESSASTNTPRVSRGSTRTGVVPESPDVSDDSSSQADGSLTRESLPRRSRANAFASPAPRTSRYGLRNHSAKK